MENEAERAGCSNPGLQLVYALEPQHGWMSVYLLSSNGLSIQEETFVFLLQTVGCMMTLKWAQLCLDV